MAMKEKAPKEKKPRLKQQIIPGAAPPSIKVIDDAADIYYDAMIERVKLSNEEVEAKQNLIDKMKSHGVDLYTTADGMVVSIVNNSNVKVKKRKDVESNGDDHED